MGKTKNYSKERLREAYQMVSSGKISLRKAAKLYNIPHTTLGDKLRGKYPLEQAPKTVLSPENEAKLAAWLVETARRGCGRTRAQLLTTVQQILKSRGTPNPFTNNKPGDKWYAGFLKRHPEVSTKKAQAQGQQRILVTEQHVRTWFQSAETIFAEYNIDIKSITPDRIFSCLETCFPFQPHTGVVLAPKKAKQVASGRKFQQITVLGCGSAAGVLLPPLLIYPSQKSSFNPQNDFPEGNFAISDNGWIDTDTFLKWMEGTFVPATKHLPKPVFLFVDGLTIHITLDLHYLCEELGIFYYPLPAHSGQVLQPLDLIQCKSLKDEWQLAVAAFYDVKQENFEKNTFAMILRDVWRRAYTPGNLINAFEAAGLCPWNPDRPNMHFQPAIPTPNTTTTATAATPTSATSAPALAKAPCAAVITPATSVSVSTATSSTAVTFPETSASASTSCQAVSPYPSVSFPSHDQMYLDLLLDYITLHNWSQTKLSKMRRRLMEHSLPKEREDEDYKAFFFLYNKIVPIVSLDTLPVPHGTDQSEKQTAPRVQPHMLIKEEKFKELSSSEENETVRKKAEKSRKRKPKEKKKAKERKERKKTERESRKLEKGKGKGGKRQKRMRVKEEETSESENEDESEHMDDSP